MSIQVAFLGPQGTFGECAAHALVQLENLGDNAKFVPYPRLDTVVEQLALGRCDAAVLPVENSVEGGVAASLDALWAYPGLGIRHSIVLPIRHALLSSGGILEISEVLSHPQALAQCSNWLAVHLPQALQLPTNSTAEAARLVAGSRFRAAIASRTAGSQNDLMELAYPVNDVAGNCTRFLLLQKGIHRNDGDIASLAFSLRHNAPGALVYALSHIAAQGLNMRRIESRPSKREFGEYVFFTDIELAEGEDALHTLLKRLQPLCKHLLNFGAYPSTEVNID